MSRRGFDLGRVKSLAEYHCRLEAKHRVKAQELEARIREVTQRKALEELKRSEHHPLNGDS